MVSVFQHYRAAPSCPVSDRRDRGVPPFFSAASQLSDIIIEGGGASYHAELNGFAILTLSAPVVYFAVPGRCR